MMYLGLVILFLALSGCGALLWQNGARHREGYAPHCGYCDRDLSGGPLTECRHCNRYLPENKIRVGVSQPLPGRILAGKATIAVGLIVLLVILGWSYRLSRSDWYCFRPTFMLIRDLDSSLAAQAAEELAIRSRVGTLSAGQTVRAADALFRRLTGPAPAPQYLYDLLGTFWEGGELSDDQARQVFEHIDQLQLTLVETEPLLHATFTGSVRAPNGWAPLRIVEVIDPAGTQPRVVFNEFHWSDYDSTTTQPTQFATSQPATLPIELRLTTVWNSFKADLLSEDFRRAQGEDRFRLLQRLKQRQAKFVAAYSQDLVVQATGLPATVRSPRRALTQQELGPHLQAPPESRPE